MDPKPILQNQCIVNGIQAFVFRLSQVAGIAPLQFERCPEGWRIRVSWLHNVYSKMVMTIFVLIIITALIADHNNVNTHFKRKSYGASVLWISVVLIVISVNLVAAYTGLHRMKHTIDAMAQIKQIHKDLEYYHTVSFPNNRKRCIVIISSLIFGCTIVLFDYGICLYETLQEDDNQITPFFYIFYYLMILNIHLIVILLVLNAMSVLPALHGINSCLKKILNEIYRASESSITTLNPEPILTIKRFRTNNYNRWVQKSNRVSIGKRDVEDVISIPSNLKHLAFVYSTLCDIVEQLNEANGLMLVLLLTSLLIQVVVTCYHSLIELIYRKGYKYYSAGLQCAWIIYHFSKVLAIIESCHRTHEEMDTTRTLVNEMIRYTPAEDFAINAELKMFYRHIVLNPTSYTPMQMFKINRDYLLTFMACLTTYLAIIAQL